MLDSTNRTTAATRGPTNLGNLGGRLRALRQAHCRTQREVASRIGVTQPAWCRWERGLTRSTIDHAILISKFFDVSLRFLLTEPPLSCIADVTRWWRSTSTTEHAELGRAIGASELWDHAVVPNL